METKKAELVFRGGCNLKNMGSTNEELEPKLTIQDVANSILQRDYKGIANWNANGVIEIWRIKQ